MKATNMTLIAALAAGSLLTLSPALRADDTNTPPSAPPAVGPPHGDRGPGMRGRGPNFDMLAQRLNLTHEQKPKVQAIFDGQREQMRGLWRDQSLSREDRIAKMRKIHEDTLAKLKTVLTAEQYQKFQDRRPMMGGRRHGPPHWGPPPDKGGTNAPAAPPQK